MDKPISKRFVVMLVDIYANIGSKVFVKADTCVRGETENILCVNGAEIDFDGGYRIEYIEEAH